MLYYNDKIQTVESPKYTIAQACERSYIFFRSRDPAGIKLYLHHRLE